MGPNTQENLQTLLSFFSRNPGFAIALFYGVGYLLARAMICMVEEVYQQHGYQYPDGKDYQCGMFAPAQRVRAAIVWPFTIPLILAVVVFRICRVSIKAIRSVPKFEYKEWVQGAKRIMYAEEENALRRLAGKGGK